MKPEYLIPYWAVYAILRDLRGIKEGKVLFVVFLYAVQVVMMPALPIVVYTVLT